MKVLRKDAEQTRQSLLSAGSAIFSDKGYGDTTIAEICERAKANIAAVNYHFGDKETLYRESWRYAYLKSIETHPPDRGVVTMRPLKNGCADRSRPYCVGWLSGQQRIRYSPQGARKPHRIAQRPGT